MKILCTSDWHAHNFSDFSYTMSVYWDEENYRYVECQEGVEYHITYEMNSRLFNVLSGISNMVNYCLMNGIHVILFAGDMFHHRGTIDVGVYNAIYRILAELKNIGITMYAIPGNHDQRDNSILPVSALYPFKDIVELIERPQYLKIDDKIELVAVPYSKNKGFIVDSIKELRAKCEDPSQAILMCHLGVDGGLVGSGMHMMSDEYSLKDLMYNKWKYVVLGHYHQPQLLEYNSFYCGTPVQNNFGDELPGEHGYNGFFIIDTDRRWNIEFVPIIAPRFITISSVEELNKLDPDFVKYHYVRVKSKASEAEKLQNALEELVGDDVEKVRLELEKDYVVEHRSDVGVTQSPEDTVKTYAHERWEDPSTLQYAIEAGLEIMEQAMGGRK